MKFAIAHSYLSDRDPVAVLANALLDTAVADGSLTRSFPHCAEHVGLDASYTACELTVSNWSWITLLV